MWRAFKKASPPTSRTAKFGEVVRKDRETIYETTGTIKATQRLCTHHLRTRPLKSREVLLPVSVLGRAIAGELLKAEHRKPDHQAMETLLAVDKPATHLIEFGYTLRDQTQKSLLKAALNFSLPGWDTNGVALKCSEFVVFVANEEEAYLDEAGRLCPPPVLTQSKVFVRVFWMTALFRRYRKFYLREEGHD